MAFVSFIRTALASWRDYPLDPGAVLRQRYTVQCLLGEGSYGLTYLAVDSQDGSQVAVKQARPSKGALANHLLTREAEVLRTLQHPNLPSFREHVTGGRESSHLLIMSYLQGDTLEELIFGQGQRFDERRCAAITLQLLELVNYIHSKGYVHLDLRIPNVLFREGGIQLIDFGLARRIGEPPLAQPSPRRAGWNRWLGNPRSLPRKAAEPASDLEDIGHFMLFMLYSMYEPETAADTGAADAPEPSWQEELEISAEMRHMIERLLQLQSPYPDTASFTKELQVFSSSQWPDSTEGR
ncbi:serine/threonine protein kinase [Paenibacillus daejeonensis]|uniref:serine/threonine protein kinase n=1 Tax=Paenibacillus daejeonensis TaxID=135193 RepID=UPI000382C147|nr:protein kinase family protein [Paenibacillus daejeonensis]